MSMLSHTRRSLISPKFVLLAQQRFCIRESTNRHVETVANRHSITAPLSSEQSFRNSNYKKIFNNLNPLQNCCYKRNGRFQHNNSYLSYQGYKQYHRRSSDDKSDHNRDDSEADNHLKTFDSKLLLSTLGVLGLFRGMTSDDIENEKSKLADEKQVKKMRPIELLIAKGVLAMCDQEYKTANDTFHEAIRIAQDENDEEGEMLLLNLLAANFFESGDFDSAEKLFIDIMKRLISSGMESTDPAILELSLKLSSIYSRNTASHDKALKGFKFVITSLLSNLQDVLNSPDEVDIRELSAEKKNELALLGWSYDWFAKHLLTVNDYSGAADMLQRALQISSKILGPLHDQTLILLNDVGTTLAMDDSPHEGKTFIKKAVEGAIESQSKEIASFYVNLGLVELKLKELSQAKRFCEYSMELASKNREHHNSYEVIELSRNCLNEVKRFLETEEH